MSDFRHNLCTSRSKVASKGALPLDTQCWLLAVASTLCEGDHRPCCSGLVAVRRALTRGDRKELANALNVLFEKQPETMPEKLRTKLARLISEVRYSTNPRVRRLSSEVVHLSLRSQRDAC